MSSMNLCMHLSLILLHNKIRPAVYQEPVHRIVGAGNQVLFYRAGKLLPRAVRTYIPMRAANHIHTLFKMQLARFSIRAKEHENGSLGKTECWYILDCDKDAKIVIGHHAKSKEELKQMIEEGRFEDLIRVIPVKKGDFFQILPGT